MPIHSTISIIGSGPAGYTAGIYAARACRNVTLICGSQAGGQLTTTTDVENYPGFSSKIQGPWLMEQMRLQFEALGGVRTVEDVINTVEFGNPNFLHSRQHKLFGDNNTYVSDVVIIATGAEAKWLNIETEKKFKGHGVSGCATCDGFFYKNKDVIVVGGGNTAVEEALHLTNHAKQVTLIHRRDTLRAEKKKKKKKKKK